QAAFGVVQNFFGVGSTPVIEGDLLLVQVGGSPRGSDAVAFDELNSNGTALVAFDKYTGAVRYKTGDDLAGYASPVLATIGRRHTNEAELRCVELATGKVMWSEPGLTRSSLLLVDNHFLCLGEDGVLRLLKVNPHKYEEVSRVELRSETDGEPLLEYPCWAA